MVNLGIFVGFVNMLWLVWVCYDCLLLMRIVVSFDWIVFADYFWVVDLIVLTVLDFCGVQVLCLLPVLCVVRFAF